MGCAECGGTLRAPARGRRPRYCSRSCQAKAYRARAAAGATAGRAAAPGPDRALTVDAVVAAAVAVADAEGTEALSMRRVAAELGAGTMSLYRYVPGKEDLLHLMVECVLADQPPHPPGLVGWRAKASAAAHRDWELYRHHPWVLPLVSSPRVALLPAMSAEVEWALAAFDGLRLTSEHRFYLVTLISGYVSGLGTLMAGELKVVRESGVELPEWWESAGAGAVAPDAHPHLANLIAAPVGSPHFADMFEFGLERVLDGIAVLLGEG